MKQHNILADQNPHHQHRGNFHCHEPENLSSALFLTNHPQKPRLTEKACTVHNENTFVKNILYS